MGDFRGRLLPAACFGLATGAERDVQVGHAWENVVAELAGDLSPERQLEGIDRVGGGCIHQAYRLRFARGRKIFLKVNEVGFRSMFEAEAAGLEEIAASGPGCVRVPRVLEAGASGELAFLALEYLELGGRGDGREMGRQVACMHRHRSPDGLYGWGRDNAIGATLQRNRKHSDWVAFFREERLRFQLELAREKGLRCDGAEELLEKIGEFFRDYQPVPSLLHGDLWGGNAGFTIGGDPVVFDPACYFGDREADMAFTRMFGGFDAAFHAGYAEEWPLDPGCEQRRDLYNLYHVLNHYNLFDGGYGEMARGMVVRLREF